METVKCPGCAVRLIPGDGPPYEFRTGRRHTVCPKARGIEWYATRIKAMNAEQKRFRATIRKLRERIDVLETEMGRR